MIKQRILMMGFMLFFFHFSTNAQDSLVIETAGIVDMSGGNIFIENGRFINNGTFTATDGTVHMIGVDVTANTSIGGTEVTTFHNLTINKTTNNVFLEQDVNVNNDLDMTLGLLEIADFNIYVDNTIINAGTQSFVSTTGLGMLRQNASPTNSNLNYPVGKINYTPIILDNAGTDDVYGVRVDDAVFFDGTTGDEATSEVVDVTWFIEENIVGGSNLEITTFWSTIDELPVFNRSNCFVSHYESGAWDASDFVAATGSNPYSVSRSNITSLSPFAVISNVDLPLDLISFEANAREKTVALDWLTEEEINSSHFEIERSFNAEDFDRIGGVYNTGEGAIQTAYQFIDESPILGTNYYRLKIVDLDGSYEYSAVRSVTFKPNGLYVGEFFPNPSYSNIGNIKIAADEATELEFQIFDVTGKLISLQNRIVDAGVSFLQIEIEETHEGQLYLIRIFLANGRNSIERKWLYISNK